MSAHEGDKGRDKRCKVDGPRSVEDIDMIRKIFGFEYTDIVRFRVELNFLFHTEEGLLKLDEKYLRQKYGDLGRKESLTPAMKSVTSTLPCIVIDRMCRTKVEDVTKDDLRQCNFYLKGIKRVTDFQIDQYMDDFALETSFGFEAIRYERDVRETLENKITTLKAELERCVAELERCKENREKVKIYEYKMSDFMKKCLGKASEWKLKNWGDKWF
ncbi:hypothetical protein TIFTF001_032874 [Ficus carica]|uniref:Uncharacterized protein n=1 Tax=Ficus carica TaxID=3494 RepID=A0AA88DY01_FICCA|nr:hypothetical protein TIFTF001_032874 [Ficus carica]